MKRFFLYCLLFLVTVTNSFAVIPSMIPSGSSSAQESELVTLKSAITEFKKLSKKERKLRINEAKKALKHLKKVNAENDSPEVNKALLIVLCFLLPPLAVYLYEDDINTKFWISVGLTLLFWIPGIIYALLVITKSI